MNKANIKSFAGLFPHLSVEQIERVNAPIVREYKQVDNNDPTSQILGVIFAPDPETGMPRSDIAIYMSEKTNPQVRDYINKFLMNQLPDSPTMVHDDDTALDGVIDRRVQSFADWRAVQRDLVDIANMSKEQYKTFLAERRAKQSVTISEE